MVARRIIIACTLILLSLGPLAAQHYAPGDTTYEYPNKGTYYHDKFHGRKTASGEIFDQNKFTAAHWKIKLGTMVMVTNQNTGLQVIVKVNDRCPKRGVFDLSHRAATAIGIRGMQPVTIRQLPDGYEEQWAAQDRMFDSVAVGPAAKKTTPETNPKKPTHNPDKEAVATGETYNLLLGTADNHGKAYNMILQLPEYYQDKVLVEQAAEGEILTLILDAGLDKSRAEELRRALQHSFPDIRLMPEE